MSETSATPIRIALAPVPAMVSTSAWYCARKVPIGVTSAGSPGLVELVSEPSTSLLPIHTETNVGFAAAIACAWVRPPRMNVVSAFAATALSATLPTSAPGTATLLT
jgi:hypothetical protein